MRPTYACATHAVFDDVLGTREWRALWRHYQKGPFAPIEPMKYAWRLEDGRVLQGPAFGAMPEAVRSRLPPDEAASVPLYPTGTPLDALLVALIDAHPSFERWVGRLGREWWMLTGHSYLYPAQTGLGWHHDEHSAYSGAFVYYVHPRWNVSWGGALLVADERLATSDGRPTRSLGKGRTAWDHAFEDDAYLARLMESGVGHFVMPRPNRLVVLGDSSHCIVPVHGNAGNHVRASVAGFFIRMPGRGGARRGAARRATATRGRNRR